MRHTLTPSEAVKITRKQDPRIFRLLAIMLALGLALSMSFGLTGFAHASPTTATHTSQAATPPPCTATHTMTFSAATGGITTFSDNSLLPGPDASQSAVTVSVSLDSSSPTEHVCTFSLTSGPFTVKDPNGNTAEVKSLNPSTVNSPGSWTPSTGALTFDGTVTLDKLPLLQGSFVTADGTLSTENNVTTNGGVNLVGVRCNSQHVCTIVGATSFNGGGFIGTVHVWLKAVGTFQ